jgi:pyruvate dehydrogenase E2 component (dihydrolipoamide acetyltransferase)
MKEVLIPSVGFAMTEALLVRWYKHPGDAVIVGEAVAEIETDKVTTDLESPATGRLGRHLAEAGTIVPVGVPLTHVLEEEEAEVPRGPARDRSGAGAGPVEPAPVSDDAGLPSPGPGIVTQGGAEPADSNAAGHRKPHGLTPRQRMQARAAAQAAGQAPPPPIPDHSATASSSEDPSAESDAGSFRDVIAARVTESWHAIPHFAVTREVSAEAILSIRANRTRRADPVPSVSDLLLRALAEALRDRGQAGEIDVGLAVATDRGVVIPVIKNVLDLDLEALASARRAAIDRARSGKLLARELADPPRTTLSNLGPFGVDQFTGIIALGQTSLLTVGRIVRRVVPVGDAMAVRATFYATLNVDHRAYDGADAAELLVAFVTAAEDSSRLDPGAFR